ncbi:MAG TPA: dephospho-CoA kinase, partial [Enhygromyxa sp.]|nr:dephospho-CoA kinase [Enhygromyxa sp.]
MEVYGLTGGIGSGKSTVAEMLEEYGIPVVSADELSRMVVAPGSHGLADVVEAFGPEVLDDKGELDRKKMGQIVFTTPERRRQLEAILHPRIRERYEQVLDALEKAGHPVMIYEVP